MAPEDNVTSAPRLAALARLAGRGKRRSGEVARFLLDVDRCSALLADELARRTYRPGAGRSFWIRDPKLRCIFALPFRDRVVQHLLIDTTLAAIESRLAPQAYACRRGRGTHRCLERATQLAGRHTFVLRIDIRRYFPSIDHSLLRRMLDPSTPPGWRWLRDVFLDGPTQVERVAHWFTGDDLFAPLRPHGLPIGSLTSQIWANVYLSPVDHLLGSHLEIGTFVRYCDDLLIFDDDKQRLRAALTRIELRAAELRLKLHPRKTRLHRTTDPVPFLGFVLRRRRRDWVQVRLQHENVVRMRARLATSRALYAAGAVTLNEVASQVRAWLAHAAHGHTRSLCEAELRRLSWTRGQVD